MFIRFDVIHERDRRTNAQTLHDSKDRACIASRSKNEAIIDAMIENSSTLPNDLLNPLKINLTLTCDGWLVFNGTFSTKRLYHATGE